jgi:hypothetical protein
MQPHLIDNLKKKFGEEVNINQSYTTPGTKEVEVVETNLQSRSRSGVGMLLYLIKKSILEIENLVRELDKCMDGATLAACKEMLRVIRFLLDTQFF